MRKLGRKKNASVTIHKKDLDIKGLTKALQEEGERLFKQAAVEFVQTAAAKVPSLTGQAKAALISVAESLGVDPGVTPDSPPESEHMHLYYYLTSKGNTVSRGQTLSSSLLTKTRTRVHLVFKFDIFSAHNGFDYFTWWDNERWNSIEEAEDSMRRFIERNFRPPELRTKNARIQL